MNSPAVRFSVIIPTYNNAQTLFRAIQSVHLQSFPAHEIIVVDDGSTDETLALVSKFGKDVRFISQVNAGVSAARNKGVECATGEWLAFLDADDEYEPDRLKLHAEWIELEPDLDFLLGDQLSCNPDGVPISTFLSSSKAGRRLLDKFGSQPRIPLAATDFESLIADGFTEVRTISVPRARFLALGGFPLGIKVGEDLHFFIRLFASSRKGGVVPMILAKYYIYPSSALRKDPLMAMRMFVDAIESLAPFIRQSPCAIRKGYYEKCRSNRLSLGYALLRKGHRFEAILRVLPVFLRHPSLQTLRDLVSISRGLRTSARAGISASLPEGARPYNDDGLHSLNTREASMFVKVDVLGD
jgi:glycosyltransferase involved in cell wall biosynthesis